MKRSSPSRLAAALLAILQALPARAADDAFALFEEEARTITASYLATAPGRVPATVRVVTAEDIEAMGARTIWDALRGLPGVEVAQHSAYAAEIGIRGINGPLNNRVLVLLDGRTVLNANFDSILWEAIPVTMEEISRIEVVEGPASALHGANAVAGVINVITKTPDQLDGGLASGSLGERGERSGAALYGKRKGRLDYKIGAGSRVGNGYSGDAQSSQTGKVHALLGWEPSSDERLSLSAGAARVNTRTTIGSPGAGFHDGVSSFLRGDWRRGETTVRAFWNRERAVMRQLASLGDPSMDYDAVDVSARRSWSLPYDDRLVLGASFRRNMTVSGILEGGSVSQDLASAFFENEWTPSSRWTLVAGGRVDRHPLAPVSFSPRASAIFAASDAHVLRASAGTAFRNPTMIENHLRVAQTVVNAPGGSLPNPPFTGLTVTSFGSRDLAPERMFQAELAHEGRFERVKTSLTGFYYELKDLIRGTDPAVVSAVPPTATLSSTYQNHGGVRAIGFEAGVEAALRPGAVAFANYSYQSLRDDDPSLQTNARGAPRHKANAGGRIKAGRLSAGLWGHWVDRTHWNRNAVGSGISYEPVPAYALLNGSLGWEFGGALEGLAASVAGFNMTGRRHFEMLGASGARPGVNAEAIGGRWTATLAYRFH